MDELDTSDPIVVADDDDSEVESAAPRLDPNTSWDPEEIDVEYTPVEEEAVDEMSPLEYIEKYGEDAYLMYTARINNCSAGLTRKFVHLDSPTQIAGLGVDEVPLFYNVCVTVLLHEISGSYMFGGFNYHDVAGRTKATIVSLFISALCDPGVGSYFGYTDAFSTPNESFFFESGNRRFYKVYVLAEALFHKSHEIDDDGARQPLSIRAMFDSKNVKGYRMWFMIADPSLCPTQAIIDRINANIRMAGLSARARTVTPYNPVILAAAQEAATAAAREDTDIDLIAQDVRRRAAAEARRINREAEKANRLLKQAEREYRKEMANLQTIDVRRVSMEVTSLVKFFELICYEERCLAPNCQNIRCAECRRKMTPDQAYLTDPQMNPDPSRRNDPWVANLENIDYRPIEATSEIGTNLDACLQSTAQRSNILQLIDAPYHFNMMNRTTMQLCNMPGIAICPEQLNQDNYYARDQRDRRVFRVPFSFAVFIYAPQIVSHPRFFQMRMPWCVDSRDFFMTSIECYAQTQRRRLSALHSRQFFQSIDPDARETVRAAAVSEIFRRFMGQTISASLAGGEYDRSHDVTALALVPTRQQQEEIDDRVVKIVDVFDREGKRFREYVARFRNCAKMLSPAEQRIIVGIIREEGRRVFQSTFREQEQNTKVCKGAIQLLSSLSKKDQSAFHNITIVSKNMPSTFANYLVQQYAMAEAAGLLYTHTLFLRLRWAAMRAAHCHETDGFFGMVTLLLNECFFGVAGAGKTYAAKVAADYLLPGAIQIISSSSDASFTDMQSQSDMIKMFDEMRPAVCPGKRGDARDDMHLNLLKEQMTSHQSTRRITQIDQGANGGPGDIMKRRVLTLHGVDHSAVCLFGNDAPPGREPSYWSRFTIHVISTCTERYGAGDIASQAVRSGGDSINNSVRSSQAFRQQWARTEHALNLAVCRQIRVGALPYPNTDVLNYMWQMAYDALKKAFPSVAGMSRAAERVHSLAITLVITHAIYLVFNSIWSPLIQIDADREILNNEPYSHEQLRAVAPLLRCDEDIAIYAITTSLFLDFCPPEHHAVAEGVARTFGQLGTSTPQYAMHRYNNQDYPNPNYVNCGTGTQIIKYIESKFGQNQYTAMHILSLLRKTTVEVDYVNPVVPSAPPSRRIVDALIMFNNQERTSGSPEIEMYMATYHISVGFVEQWSPKTVLELVMGAMSHNKIQRRQVVIGQTIEKTPFLPSVWQLVPGTHSVDLSQFTETKSYIRDALVGTYSVTREGDEYRQCADSEEVPVIDESADPETYLTVRWLENNVELPSGISPRYFTRKEIERATETRLKEWFPAAAAARKNYPRDIFNEYAHTGVELRADVDPSSDIFEEDFGQALRKQAPPPPAASSSSSSSSSKGHASPSLQNLCASHVSKGAKRPAAPLPPVDPSNKRPCVRPAE